MPAMSFEIIRNNFQNWIDPKFNLVVSNITAAYYPQIFHEANSFSLMSRMVDKGRKLVGLPDIKIRQEKLSALKNIYELGIFVHYAGCSHYMTPFHNYLSDH